MVRFDSQDLRLVVAIARSGSITAGAAAVHLAVASASERLKVLEASVGAPLFKRVARGVTLTPAGDVMLRHAQAVLELSQGMEQEIAKLTRGLQGEVRVATNSVAMTRFLREPLITFLRANPGINVALEEAASSDARQMILQGKVDLAVAALDQAQADMETRPLFVDRLVAIMSRSHPLSMRARLRLAELLNYDLLMLGSRSALHTYLRQQVAELGGRISCRISVDDFSTLCRMAEAGIGVGIAPASCVARFEDMMAIRSIALQEAWSERRIGVFWSRDNPLDAPADRLLACLLEAAGQNASA